MSGLSVSICSFSVMQAGNYCEQAGEKTTGGVQGRGEGKRIYTITKVKESKSKQKDEIRRKRGIRRKKVEKES